MDNVKSSLHTPSKENLECTGVQSYTLKYLTKMYLYERMSAVLHVSICCCCTRQNFIDRRKCTYIRKKNLLKFRVDVLHCTQKLKEKKEKV